MAGKVDLYAIIALEVLMGFRVAGVITVLILMLACGGAVGALGSPVGPYAKSMSEYYQTQTPGIPCPTYNVSDEVTVGSFTYRIESVSLMDGENALPWIQNGEERRDFSKEGVKALGIRYAMRNNTPVKLKKPDTSMKIVSTDGEKAYWQPYNSKLFRADQGLEDEIWEFPPGTWVSRGGVVSVAETAADGVVAWISHSVSEYDPTDPRGRRKIDVIYGQAVIDLGTPIPAPHNNPAKR